MIADLSLQTLSGSYASLGIGRLTAQEETYVQRRTQGINPSAAARAAGFRYPARAVAEMAQREDITLAISYMREMQRQVAVQAGALEFTRDDATALYLEAHAKSATAMEEIRAVDSLVKLHGLATPDRVEINVTNRGQMENMDDEQLLKLAGQDIQLSPDEYVEVGDAE
ncbi:MULTISPECIES: hypothetical protein [unclassified Pseudoalteromonas]|uniref:hypothetical protein n=1 Tax=unclassified Pseudoalteromonas TaxID=194690 RepID=UPI0013FD916F|nr:MULTISPECIES: hypothetical protein [unclassified Pseudoalteromonas]MBH0050706.1 hypothetical protein [Pseudoalteromonas sp. SWYJZ19]